MSEMSKLIFADISARIKDVEGQKHIWDALRKRWLVLTPEEWVRQHTIAWLISEKRVPALRISQEYPVNLNGQNQRADIVVVDEFGKPFILVECKAPDIAIDDAVVAQMMRYNRVLDARFVVLTNGRGLWCYEHRDGQYRQLR